MSELVTEREWGKEEKGRVNDLEKRKKEERKENEKNNYSERER